MYFQFLLISGHIGGWKKENVFQRMSIDEHVFVSLRDCSCVEETCCVNVGTFTYVIIREACYCIFKSLIEISWRRSQLLTMKCHFQQQWSVLSETWSKHMVLKYPLKHNFSFLFLHSMLKWDSWKTHPCQGRSINASPYSPQTDRERERDSHYLSRVAIVVPAQLEYSWNKTHSVKGSDNLHGWIAHSLTLVQNNNAEWWEMLIHISTQNSL